MFDDIDFRLDLQRQCKIRHTNVSESFDKLLLISKKFKVRLYKSNLILYMELKIKFLVIDIKI